MTPGPYAGRVAVLATMHGKEAAFAPILAEQLGLDLMVPEGIDTDALGTFTGEVARQGTVEDAALAKAALGLSRAGGDLALASEGAYGPHPRIPFIPFGVEVVAWVDKRIGLTLVERLYDETPVYDHLLLDPDEDPGSFLARIGFPAQRVIVGADDDAVGDNVIKGIGSVEQLGAALAKVRRLSTDGKAFIQTDMRAHCNPHRMETLGRLAQKLARRLETACPVCAAPGFGKVGVEMGLPCAWCAGPTVLVRAERWGCGVCGLEETRPRKDGLTEGDPGTCPRCNP
ncbi:hypothetical protein U879_06945 [Defluviimonas sp. 20V17]|uniref:DUF6671 domain-containing protein n=1 Tax=Allgaiera indica TaxID=765699 RepID=A0AAN4UTP4_9RHOB|nr:hypothetical protein U879_06945 [Defluviimonas sp. 20V17]GHE04213.1 hypothetical protein GCM10008024_30660 [Allgaiera indica]SDX94852.1 hypothetical protein SAMN05444006_1506 [Allgaiera indica]